MTDVVDEITKARGSVYGPFLHNAVVAQEIKDAIRRGATMRQPENSPVVIDWFSLPLDVREALDLIALKMSRVVTGDPEYLDNWDDIGGYAKIVADRIRRGQSETSKAASNRSQAKTGYQGPVKAQFTEKTPGDVVRLLSGVRFDINGRGFWYVSLDGTTETFYESLTDANQASQAERGER